MSNKLYIGDNLKIMKSKELSKYSDYFKMIYIDPPYNTNSIKSYNDKIDSCEWKKYIEKRIKCSKNLLREDGAIFISIDDNEFATLKMICDNVFGKDNFVGTFVTQQAQRSNAKHINIVHEYIVCYAKDKSKLKKFQMKRVDYPEERNMIKKLKAEIETVFKSEGQAAANRRIKSIIKEYCYKYNISWLKNYSNVDEEGRIYFASDLSTPSNPRTVDIPSINLHLEPLERRGWVSDKRFIKLYNENRLCFKDGRPYVKLYLDEATDNVPSILKFYSRQGTNDLKKLGLADLFDTPKPVELIKFLIRISTDNDDAVLDFFAGSGTTAQAVYEVNAENGRNNSYVLIQLDEEIAEKTKVYDKCVSLGIQPIVSNITMHRINTFLELNNLQDDYEIISYI